MTRTLWWRRASTLALLLVCTASCGGGEDATPGGYSDVCSSNKDCEDGLECATGTTAGSGVCTGRCLSTPDCAKFSANAVCVNFCFESCTDSIPCKRLHPSLQCVQSSVQSGGTGTCKVP